MYVEEKSIKMTELKIFPDDGREFCGRPLQTNFFTRILGLAREARESIHLIQYVFGISQTREWQRSNKFFKALIEAKRRGVELKLIFDRPRIHGPNTKTNIACAIKFREAEIEVRALTIHKTLHLKMILFDQKIMLTGSHNVTNSSLYSPFELSFEYRDPEIIKESECYFRRLWNDGISEPFLEAVEKMGKERK